VTIKSQSKKLFTSFTFGDAFYADDTLRSLKTTTNEAYVFPFGDLRVKDYLPTANMTFPLNRQAYSYIASLGMYTGTKTFAK